MKIIAYLVINLSIQLCFVSLSAQEKRPLAVYHHHVQTCYYIGTEEVDHLLVLRDDSTIKYVVYTTNYKNGYRNVLRQTYSGRYTLQNDTLQAAFTTYLPQWRKKGIKSAEPASQPDSIMRLVQFEKKGVRVIPMQVFFPEMKKASVLLNDRFAIIFDQWENLDKKDNTVFGVKG